MEPIISKRQRLCRPVGRANNEGFTVAEILIAIFIFSIIVTTVFGSYRATSEQIEIVSKNRQLVEMGRNCLDRMTRDLKALRISLPPEYSKPEIDSDPDPYRIVGTTETTGGESYARLRFTSFAHLPIQPSRPFGIARIVYYVQEDQDGRSQLHRADQLYPYENFEPDPLDPVLCGDVRSFAVTFYDNEGQSHDAWDSEDRTLAFATPVSIKIWLEIGNEEDAMVMSTRISLDVLRGPVESE